MTEENLKRWRLILGNNPGFREGKGKGNGTGESVDDCAGDGEGEGNGDSDGDGMQLSADERNIDKALEVIYKEGDDAKGDLSKSCPNVAHWLGEVRNYFPDSMVQIIQRDAIKRMNLIQLLSEPEMLEAVTPNVNLAATILAMSKSIPEKYRESARIIVRRVVEQLTKQLSFPLIQAVGGRKNKSQKKRNPKKNCIDWNSTILKNLRHYQPEYKTIIPEVLIGYTNRRREMQDLIIAVDESASMMSSLVFTGVYASVLASIPTINTRLVVFDTDIVDLTDSLSDPVEVLFGFQMGGGTNIENALRYCRGLVSRPADTFLVVVTDLMEGSSVAVMRRRFAELVAAGIHVIVLLALNDQGAPMYDHSNADFLASINIPCFACTPDMFPSVMADFLNNRSISVVDSNSPIV
jgi:hypothetical protein